MKYSWNIQKGTGSDHHVLPPPNGTCSAVLVGTSHLAIGTETPHYYPKELLIYCHRMTTWHLQTNSWCMTIQYSHCTSLQSLQKQLLVTMNIIFSVFLVWSQWRFPAWFEYVGLLIFNTKRCWWVTGMLDNDQRNNVSRGYFCLLVYIHFPTLK